MKLALFFFIAGTIIVNAHSAVQSSRVARPGAFGKFATKKQQPFFSAQPSKVLQQKRTYFNNQKFYKPQQTRKFSDLLQQKSAISNVSQLKSPTLSAHLTVNPVAAKIIMYGSDSAKFDEKMQKLRTSQSNETYASEWKKLSYEGQITVIENFIFNAISPQMQSTIDSLLLAYFNPINDTIWKNVTPEDIKSLLQLMIVFLENQASHDKKLALQYSFLITKILFPLLKKEIVPELMNSLQKVVKMYENETIEIKKQLLPFADALILNVMQVRLPKEKISLKAKFVDFELVKHMLPAFPIETQLKWLKKAAEEKSNSEENRDKAQQLFEQLHAKNPAHDITVSKKKETVYEKISGWFKVLFKSKINQKR